MKSEGSSVALSCGNLEKSCTFFSFLHFNKCRVIIHASVPDVVEFKMALILCSNHHQEVTPGSSPLKSGAGLVILF